MQLKNNRDYLEERFQVIFRQLFVNRYRDISEHIRTACIRELGVWIKTLTTKLLEASYIKYIAWSLNDKVDFLQSGCLLLRNVLVIYLRK